MVARLDHPTAAAEHNAASPPLKCPRCDSPNTKFCYYNNYSLAQPRHFCKSCKRYWTRGGTLRNVPVGGGCRKNKRGKKSHRSPPPTTAASQSLPPPPPPDLNSFLYGFPPMINSSSTLFFPKFELDTSLATYEENFHSSLNAPAPVDFIGDYSLLNSRTDTSYDDLNIRAENNNGLNSFDGTNCLATSGAVAQSSYLYWPESGSSVAPLI